MTGVLGKLGAVLAAVVLAFGPATTDPAPAPLRILTIGDSITAAGQYQAELGRQLTLAGVPYVIDNEGNGGSRCSRWPSLIQGLLVQHQPDLVILACGTNDDPNEMIYGESMTGWSFRSTVEQIHAFRPAKPILVLPAIIGYSDPLLAPDWLTSNEARTNDILWVQMTRYLPPNSSGWFAGVWNIQLMPATATFLGDDGIHPVPKGYVYMGRMAYDAAAPGMQWPASTDPPLCDLYGHRKGYPRPSYLPCS